MTKVKGYSRNSFEEALDDAIRNAPADPASENTADDLYIYTIARSGKETGGIAGRNHFFVELELPY